MPPYRLVLVAAAVVATTSTCPNSCSHRGVCSAATGLCTCYPGFDGSDCSLKACPHGCSAAGKCVDGKCVCDAGRAGLDCSLRSCPNDCSGRGFCDVATGQCACRRSWGGADCASRLCPGDGTCSGKGRCVGAAGTCECDSGWSGPTCAERACPSDCHGGACINGTCACVAPRHGVAARVGCPNGCSEHGVCLHSGECQCLEGWSSIDCSVPTCPKRCSGRGTCSADLKCRCEDGWEGPGCETPKCPNDCSGAGLCHQGKCHCELGRYGEDCAKRLCPNQCSGHGECAADGTCKCFDGWGRFDCSERKCPMECAGWARFHGVPSLPAGSSAALPLQASGGPRGACVNGSCVCASGWGGPDCGEMVCPGEGGKLCSGHGACDTTKGACLCEDGWTGEGCQKPSCNGRTCLNGAKCVAERCYCAAGWTGEDCGSRLCPGGCSGKGACSRDGVCGCISGWGGVDCSEPSCPRNATGAELCSAKGQCVYDQLPEPLHSQLAPRTDAQAAVAQGVAGKSKHCECIAGWTGPGCDQKRCPRDCSGAGACVDGTYCEGGCSGAACEFLPCPVGEGRAADGGGKVCSGRGMCVRGECECAPGFEGRDCSARVCPGGANHLSTPTTGVNSSVGSTAEVCSGHGVCNPSNGKCSCDGGWQGTGCESRSCPYDCHGHGKCLGGVCYCEPGFEGDTCAFQTCPNRCSARGASRPRRCARALMAGKGPTPTPRGRSQW